MRHLDRGTHFRAIVLLIVDDDAVKCVRDTPPFREPKSCVVYIRTPK